MRQTTLLILASGWLTLSAQERITWVLLGPERDAIARTVLSGSEPCPQIVLDGRSSPMRARTPAPAGFPPLCEAAIPPGTRAASVNAQALPLPAASFKRIVVIGDTGCRVRELKPGDSLEDLEIQDCDTDWKFKPIAEAAAARQPDLVIHTGDYVYREGPCPPGKPCQGPHGFQWNTWYTDFFQPANKLLRAAPWIFVRGNHESCEQGGAGWFYLLDPRPYRPASCDTEYSEPYSVKAGGMDFQVLDSSLAEELDAKKKQVAEYARQLRDIGTSKPQGAWLLTHQPFWAFRREAGDSKRNETDSVNDTLQKAWRDSPVSGIDLVLSGHIHIFQVLSFADGRPPQLVVGNSGTEMSRRIKGPFQGRKIARTTVADAGLARKHGFAEMNRRDGGWQLDLHGLKEVELRCLVTGPKLSCAK